MIYQHKEAYCLMLYQCEKCRATEIFWNSRDGVTPFIVLGRCRFCQGNMQHVEFQRDTCAPYHVPQRGQGVFTDMPDALKRTYGQMRVNQARAAGHVLEEDAAEAIAKGFQPGTPFFFRWGM